jgi:hypothetical protein
MSNGGRRYVDTLTAHDKVEIGTPGDRATFEADSQGARVDKAFQINGAFGAGSTFSSVDVNLDLTIYYAFIDASGSGRVAQLPVSAPIPNGRSYLVQKTDATGNTVTVLPAVGDTINGAGSVVLAGQLDAVIVSWSSIAGEWKAIPFGGGVVPPPPVPTLTVTAGENLLAGHVVAYDSSNPSRAILADPDSTLSPSKYDAKGVALSSALAGTVTQIYSIPGQRVPVRFAVAPPASANGSRVYLSTSPGVASLTAPPAVNALVQVGILVGANGASFTPDVVFEFNVIALIA